MELTALENDRLRFATHPVSRALALSLALHLLLFGTVELSRFLKLQLPEWLKSVLDLSRQASVEKKAAPADQEPPTLTFVEVNPAQATPEPPKDTKNYSAFNSLAQTVLVHNARTLEDLVREMLRPLLKTWLDDNLPGLVERLVRAEIERVARGSR